MFPKHWLLCAVFVLTGALPAFPCSTTVQFRPKGTVVETDWILFANNYRRDGMLVLLNKWNGFLSPMIAVQPLYGCTIVPLGPVNEQLRSPEDPWVELVREQARPSDGLSIVFRSRAYKAVGPSFPEWWEKRIPNGPAVRLPDSPADPAERHAACGAYLQEVQRFKRPLTATSPDGRTSAEIRAESTDLTFQQRGKELFKVPLPQRGQHWNYPTSIAWSPADRFVLVGSHGGSSDSHFEDYWLLDLTDRSWRHVGGGNNAKWSRNGAMIAWISPRELASLRRINVWVAHLAVFEVATLRTQTLTSGLTYDSDFYWCGR